MTISTQMLLNIMFGLTALLVLILLVKRVRRSQLREDDPRQDIENDTSTDSPGNVDPADNKPVTSEVPHPAPETGSVETEGPTPDISELPATQQPSASETVSADRFMAWTPPPASAWQPSAKQSHEVSWSDQKLFGTPGDNFADANNLPSLKPDQVPSTDDSDYVFGPATSVMSAVMPAQDIERTGKDLSRAGYHQPHAMQNLQAIRFMLLFASLFLGGCAIILVPKEFELWAMLGTIGLAAFVWSMPRIFLQNRATERTSQLERAMPDMLDMLNMCVSQGLTIPDSLKRISRDLKPVYPALATELTIVVHQAEVGNLRIALDNFSDRVDVPEVDSFVSLMNQSEQMGTNVSDALTEYSNTMRESLRQRTDEKANQAAFRLMFPTVLFMMPAVFGFLMGPAILELQDFFDGGGLENLSGGTDISTITNELRQPTQ